MRWENTTIVLGGTPSCACMYLGSVVWCVDPVDSARPGDDVGLRDVVRRNCTTSSQNFRQDCDVEDWRYAWWLHGMGTEEPDRTKLWPGGQPLKATPFRLAPRLVPDGKRHHSTREVSPTVKVGLRRIHLPSIVNCQDHPGWGPCEVLVPFHQASAEIYTCSCAWPECNFGEQGSCRTLAAEQPLSSVSANSSCKEPRLRPVALLASVVTFRCRRLIWDCSSAAPVSVIVLSPFLVFALFIVKVHHGWALPSGVALLLALVQ